MGLVESENEEVRNPDSRSPSPGSHREKEKRKRDLSENDSGRKKWKGPKTRYCNLYLQGKCPRVSFIIFLMPNFNDISIKIILFKD